MPKKGRKLTPAQRAVALKNLAKARRARKATTTGTKPKRKRKLTDKKRKRLGYTKERTVAKAKKRRSTKKRRGGGRRRSGGGLMGGLDFKGMIGAGAYGMLEKQVAEKGEEAILKKVPLFFDGIGYAGCAGIIAHIIGRNVGGVVGQAARHFSDGTLKVAAYKLAKNGKLYESKAEAEAALAGDDDLSGDDEIGFELEGDELGDDEVGYGADGIAGDDD